MSRNCLQDSNLPKGLRGQGQVEHFFQRSYSQELFDRNILIERVREGPSMGVLKNLPWPQIFPKQSHGATHNIDLRNPTKLRCELEYVLPPEWADWIRGMRTNSMLNFMIVILDTQVLFLARTNPCRYMNSNSKWCSQLLMSYINLEQPTQAQLHEWSTPSPKVCFSILEKLYSKTWVKATRQDVNTSRCLNEKW